MVLKEIYAKPLFDPDDPEFRHQLEKSLEKAFGVKGKVVQIGGKPSKDEPYYHNVASAMEVFNRIFGYLASDAKHIIQSKPKSKNLSIAVDHFQYSIEIVISLFHHWQEKLNKPLKKIDHLPPELLHPLSEPSGKIPMSKAEREFANIMWGTDKILHRAYNSINNPKYKNLINARRDMEYFNTMLKKARKMVDNLLRQAVK